MQLINRVTGIEGVGVTRQVMTQDQKDTGNTFSQVLAKESRKQTKQDRNNSVQNGHTDWNKMQYSMASYNQLARPVIFSMTLPSTDLKG